MKYRTELLVLWYLFAMKRVHSVGILLVQYYLSVASYAVSRGGAVQLAIDWSSDAIDHVRFMEDLLYPPGDSMKVRLHQVKQHPIYNFLHTYYRYSTKNIKKYSPGLGVIMETVPDNELTFLNEKFLKITPEGTVKPPIVLSIYQFVCLHRQTCIITVPSSMKKASHMNYQKESHQTAHSVGLLCQKLEKCYILLLQDNLFLAALACMSGLCCTAAECA